MTTSHKFPPQRVPAALQDAHGEHEQHREVHAEEGADHRPVPGAPCARPLLARHGGLDQCGHEAFR